MTDTTNPLRLTKRGVWHFNDAGKRVDGPHAGLTGISPCLRGNVSGLRGDVSGLWGNVSGLWGDASGLCGDLDMIPASARPANIADFVSKE